MEENTFFSLEDIHHECTKTSRKLHNYIDSPLETIKSEPKYMIAIEGYLEDLCYQVKQLKFKLGKP
jgi:hypothetical protein